MSTRGHFHSSPSQSNDIHQQHQHQQQLQPVKAAMSPEAPATHEPQTLRQFTPGKGLSLLWGPSAEGPEGSLRHPGGALGSIRESETAPAPVTQSRMAHHQLRHLSPLYQPQHSREGTQHRGEAPQPQGQVPPPMYSYAQRQGQRKPTQHDQRLDRQQQEQQEGEQYGYQDAPQGHSYLSPSYLSSPYLSQAPAHQHPQPVHPPQGPVPQAQPPVYLPPRPAPGGVPAAHHPQEARGPEEAPLPVQRSRTEPQGGSRPPVRHGAPGGAPASYHSAPEGAGGAPAVYQQLHGGRGWEGFIPGEPLAVQRSHTQPRRFRPRHMAPLHNSAHAAESGGGPSEPWALSMGEELKGKEQRGARTGRLVALGQGAPFVAWSRLGSHAFAGAPLERSRPAEGEGPVRLSTLPVPVSIPNVASCDGRLEGRQPTTSSTSYSFVCSASPSASPQQSRSPASHPFLSRTHSQPEHHMAGTVKRGTSLPKSRSSNYSPEVASFVPSALGRTRTYSADSTKGTKGMNSTVDSDLPDVASLVVGPGKSCLKKDGCALGVAKQVTFNGIVSVRKYLTRGRGK